MAYCPLCLMEYEKGSRECIHCHVPLRVGSPPRVGAGTNELDEPAHEKLVRVRFFTGRGGRLEAQLAREILKQEGIPCVLPGERAPDLYPAMELIQLLVLKTDAARAAEILHDYLDNPPDSLSQDEPTSE